MKTRKMRFTRKSCVHLSGIEDLSEDFAAPKRYKYAEICVNRLAKFVDFPEDTKTIIVIGHTRPGVDRMKIGQAGNGLKIDGEYALMYPDTRDLAARWIKTGHKYISIEY